MKIITGGRCTGKTYELIKRAAENHGVIITADRNMKDAFTKFYIPEMVSEGIIPEDHRIIVTTLSTALKGATFFRNGELRKAYIDELDLTLSTALWDKGLDIDSVVLCEKPSVQWEKMNHEFD